MVITADMPWRTIGDTTWGAFVDELGRVDSPMLEFAEPIYRAAQGFTRLFLAHSQAENIHDTVGILIRPDMRNPLALRARYGEPTRNGFAIYPDYPSCVAAWRKRFDDPNLGYRATTTLADYCRVYNPTGDTHPVTGLPNDPLRYCRELLATINRLPPLEEQPPMALPFRQSFIPWGNRNRPGTTLNPGPLWITVHETGNPNAGATAEMHRVFTHQGGGEATVSFHYVVDSKEAIQLLPTTEIGWHAGDCCDSRTDDLGCFASVAIETCVNAGADWNQTKRNLAELMAKIIREDSRFSISRIVQHNRWSGKDCPQRMRAEGSLPSVIATTASLMGTPTGTTTPAPRLFPMAPPEIDDAFIRDRFPEADPKGTVTPLWLSLGRYPRRDRIDAVAGGRRFVFADGTTIFAPSNGQPYIVGAAKTGGD